MAKAKTKTMSSLTKKLNEPLPKEAIKQREGGRGMMLDYLEGWWAIKNANKLFGIDNWSYEAVWERLEHITLPNTAKGKKSGLYTVPVILKVKIGDKEVVRSDIGMTQYYGEQGKEMAIKGCVTDALKRCLRTFGAQFGLELYDKGDITPPTTRVQGRKPYLSQQQLMEQFKMDVNQKPPTCPDCQSGMKLVPRKDGSSLFWSCPNWRSKGCKGYNVDDVDIDGNLTPKKGAIPKKPVKKDDVKTDDIPF